MTIRLQLKITIENISPPIWRRVVVADDITFKKLHTVIQRAFGWDDYHMHEFLVGKLRVGTRSSDGFFGAEQNMVSESRATLADMLEGKRKFRYWYDFGDDWWHEIAIEKRLPPDETEPPAKLLDGARACPPEDCGGPWGYANLIEALANPDKPENQEFCDWAEGYDPEAFDLPAAAQAIAGAIRRSKAKKS